MRRLVATFIVLSVLASYLVFFALPVSASGDQICELFQYTMRNDTGSPASVTWDLISEPPSHDYSATLTLQPGETKDITLKGLFPASSVYYAAFSGNSSLTFVGEVFFNTVANSVCSGGFGKIGDGRINDGPDQLGAPLAAYCTADGGIAVWDIDAEGHGTLGFTATKDQISKALADAQSSGHNVLIGQGLGNSLYALSSNQLTLVGPDVKESGKTYEFVAPADVCSS